MFAQHKILPLNIILTYRTHKDVTICNKSIPNIRKFDKSYH